MIPPPFADGASSMSILLSPKNTRRLGTAEAPLQRGHGPTCEAKAVTAERSAGNGQVSGWWDPQKVVG